MKHLKCPKTIWSSFNILFVVLFASVLLMINSLVRCDDEVEKDGTINRDSTTINVTDPEFLGINLWDEMDQIESDDSSPIVLIAKPFGSLLHKTLSSPSSPEEETSTISSQSDVSNQTDDQQSDNYLDINSTTIDQQSPIKVEIYLDKTNTSNGKQFPVTSLNESMNSSPKSVTSNLLDYRLTTSPIAAIDSTGIIGLRPLPIRMHAFPQYDYKVSSHKFTNFRKKFFPKILAL